MDVTPDMLIWREEVFGPVMVITSFTSISDAIHKANDCPYALGSSIWTRSCAPKFGAKIDAGMLSINDFVANYMCQDMPFGGMKASGFGRFAGIEGLRWLCNQRSVCVDSAPLLMGTTIPGPWHYPVHKHGHKLSYALSRIFFS